MQGIDAEILLSEEEPLSCQQSSSSDGEDIK